MRDNLIRSAQLMLHSLEDENTSRDLGELAGNLAFWLFKDGVTIPMMTKGFDQAKEEYDRYTE